MQFAGDHDLFVQQKGAGGNTASEQYPCGLCVKTLEDRRGSTTFFSEFAHYETFAKSVPQWVRDGILSLGQHGYAVQFGSAGAAPPATLTANVKIQRAYVHQTGITRSAIVVLAVDYEKNGASLDSKIYRGQDIGVNWSGSAAEMESAMNRALTSVLAAFAVDIDRLCIP